jgi:UDP-glucose 4-epimerase
VGSTLLLSRWCLDHSVRRFLFPSSMNVYGHGNREPVEEDRPPRPIGYYGGSKLASETYLRLAADAGLSVTCFRIYNAYGRGQNLGNRYQGMASIYLAYLLDRAPVLVTGSLDRYRDFVHVDDIVDAFCAALYRPSTPSFVYNIGTGRKVAVRDVLKLLVASMGFPDDYPIQEQAGVPGDVFGSVANNSRAKDELGWAPHVKFEQGLADMVTWAKTEPWPQMSHS